jgi:hypothetical protein
MFEIIGLLFGIGLLFVLSIALGSVYGFVAWIVTGPGSVKRWFTALVAACIPPVSAVYLLICAVGISILATGQGDLLFGGIYEPLPNGYSISALGKMPDYGIIRPRSETQADPKINGFVGRVDVEGQFVYGAYSHRDLSLLTETNLGYFALNTETDEVRDFGTQRELDQFAGYPVHLVENWQFRSKETWYQRRLEIERWISFGPPIMLSVLYFVFLAWSRKFKGA